MRKDKQDYCINGQFTERGIKEVHGFMTEFYVDDEKYFTHVPEDLRELAVMAEPLTIAEKACAGLRRPTTPTLGLHRAGQAKRPRTTRRRSRGGADRDSWRNEMCC